MIKSLTSQNRYKKNKSILPLRESVSIPVFSLFFCTEMISDLPKNIKHLKDSENLEVAKPDEELTKDLV